MLSLISEKLSQIKKDSCQYCLGRFETFGGQCNMADACLCPTLGLKKSNPVRQEDIFNANAKIVGH